MLIKRPDGVKSSEITSEQRYLERRKFMQLIGGAAVALGASTVLEACSSDPGVADFAVGGGPAVAGAQSPLSNYKPKVVSVDEPLNSFEDITSYNNFYEFGTGKNDPQRYAGKLKTSPWKVRIDGHCSKPADYHLEDLIKPHQLEERIYRLRCVEAWSMVIPWIGIPLAEILKRAEPTSKATFVRFTTLHRPSEMFGQNQPVLEWPYVEGLRMDEAMHPLTILSVGLYGKTLMNQNGAPIRLVVPWKYGFKSIKSIVRIEFVDRMPATSWVEQNPAWYGFYSNVNPDANPVRWDQSRERRIGELFPRKTVMFNGYADQVASMYAGMDLKKLY